ncbi:hypothetical protein H9Q13_12505 [Pontibacter sp. JH31]|uniref:Uncharacterized protein n=1 Tax=Pontibacter aquaedesilientis TaxID=2766980 RepID=A0ABR7XI68_9BACT|nr:hypothetical protein [Pontibacter aquaedesilientis]MBD1397990.1 hypothetical protein [Pontibacter aquaedesilientis]
MANSKFNFDLIDVQTTNRLAAYAIGYYDGQLSPVVSVSLFPVVSIWPFHIQTGNGFVYFDSVQLLRYFDVALLRLAMLVLGAVYVRFK